jgi:hypothetical protein
MTDPKKPAEKKVLEGKVIPSAKAAGPLSALDGLNALKQVVDAARECWVVHEQESSKRARIRAYEQTEVARIRAAEGVLKNYFEQVFAERRGLYEDLFARLDQAMAADNGEAVHAVLRGIVDVAKTSPIADMGDLGEIRKALDDDIVWEL